MPEASGLPVALVRPALELAVVVARAGAVATPAVAAPGPLRPLLRFARLPDRSLGVVESIVANDEAFRSRVAEAASEENAGRAGWLWLVRPDGWEQDLADLVSAARTTEAEVEDRRAERSARQRLAGVEAALRRSDAELSTARAALGRVADEVAELRRDRRSAEDAAAAARAELGDEQDRSAALVGRVEEVTAARRTTDERAASVQRDLQAVVVDRDRLRAALDAARADLDGARSDLEATRRRCRDVEVAVADGRATVGSSVLDAAAAARALGEALAAAAEAVGALGPVRDELPTAPGPGGRTGPDARHAPASPPTSSPVGPARRGAGPRAAPGSSGARRTPVPLPAATFDDSPEAALHLVRVPGVVVLVDGYNVSIAAWPDLDIAVQRQRLVPALDELSARTGATVQVVFDGAEDATGAAPRVAHRPVRVLFSPAGVDADEVIIEMVDDLPARRPVVVATSDRRVADEVGRRGANVITTPQFLGLLRRATPGA